ncbi:MAG: magnesium/cobalt transporter CorA [Vulcanimicrobiota bacterium]
MSARKKRKKKHRPVIGSTPGTLVAAPGATETVVSSIRYDAEHFTEKVVEDLGKLLESRRPGTLWLNFEGLKDVEAMEKVGKHFGIHRLALEDIVYSQRPRADEFEGHLFLSLAMLDPETRQLEQLAIFLGKDHVLTFQEGVPGDCLGSVRDRLREGKGQIRKRGADYLAYALVDNLVDTYFPLVDSWAHELDTLEDKIEKNHRDKQSTARIRYIRREAGLLRRVVRHMREGISAWSKSRSPLLTEVSRPYFKDCLDHAVELHEELEHLREWTTELLNSHQSNLAQQTNEAMQTLTVIGAIFIPLSFIAGLYGMNFDPSASPWNMPELKTYYGYPFVLFLMASVAGGFLVFFRRKGWT